jgi:serine O-acetyltransferase
MAEEKNRPEICESEQWLSVQPPEKIDAIVNELISSCVKDDCYNNVDLPPLPSMEALIGTIKKVRDIIFPGYFSEGRIDSISLKYHMGRVVLEIFEELNDQIILSMRHKCLRGNLPCSRCFELAHEAALEFISSLPELRIVLAEDVRAAIEGDPAVKNEDEVIFSYPGLFAIAIYRIAHILYGLHIPLIPRMMTEYAHRLTGIDIHPGATIGKSFFIDHGTGIVIGETTEIGDRVRVYQGVTLGALSLPKDSVDKMRDKKRHPTIEDDVIIYSNATILGEKAVIGARSVIGGNVWITESVPPDTKVISKQRELVYVDNNE